MFFHMYIALAQEWTSPWGQKFDVNSKALSVSPFVASYKKISSNSDFIFSNVFPHVYSPHGRGRQPLGDKILMSTERPYHFAHLV